MKDSRAGFTLIELLVVIGILSLLVVTFAPDIIGAFSTANAAADSKQLSDHYSFLFRFKERYKHWPEGGGHNFLIEPWTKGIIDHTPSNLDKFFTPGPREKDPRWLELKKLPIEEVWKDGNLTSEDTTYAGRAKAHMRTIDAGAMEPLAADDNEGAWNIPDGRINVLRLDGKVYTLDVNTDLKDYGATKEVPFEVGPNSPHPDLQKLEK